jgi:uncharacterized membrane protein YfcA
MENTKRPERRKGSDTVTKSISIFSGITWLLILVVFVIISYAQPKAPTVFDRNSGMSGQQTWDKSLLGYAAVALTFTAIICIIGLSINSIRHRRRSDYYNRSLLVFGIGSILGIFAYFIFG